MTEKIYFKRQEKKKLPTGIWKLEAPMWIIFAGSLSNTKYIVLENKALTLFNVIIHVRGVVLNGFRDWVTSVTGFREQRFSF